MRSISIVSTALLAATSWAAPAQHPLMHKQLSNPYKKGYSDPYDHKVDSIGRDLHPEPLVSGSSGCILMSMSDVR